MAMPTALTRPLDAAADLVKFAVDSGGLDNITVVLVPFPPVDRAGKAGPPAQAEQPTRVDQSEYPTRVD
jgi:serine/threonine protein phosphatase PrpC